MPNTHHHLVVPTLSASLPTATISSDVPPVAHPSSPFPRLSTPRPPFGLFPAAVLLSQSCVYPPRLRACFLLTHPPAFLFHSHLHPTVQSLPSLYPQLNSFHYTHAQLPRATSTLSFPARFTQLRAPSSLTRAPPAPPPPPSIRLRSVARLRFTRSAQRPTHTALAPLFRVGARAARVVG